MKTLIAAAALAFINVAPFQEPSVEDLIKKLGSDDVAAQGKAAADLERLGKQALADLRRWADDPAAKEQIRAWCRKISAKIEALDHRIKDLITKLASADDETREAAEEGLRKIGRAAIPYLEEATKSEDRNLRRRADRLRRELEADTQTERAEEDAGFSEGSVADGFKFKFRVVPKKEPAASTAAVLAALKWLARHQNTDGSWGSRNFPAHCVEAKCRGAGDSEYDAGVTGLAILAFLGAGHSHLSKAEHADPLAPDRMLKFGEVVKNGLKWLMVKQDPEGCIGFRGIKYMYNHCIATLALAEAHGMTGSALIKGAAKRGVDFIIEAQNPGRAWRYVKQGKDNDTSVTGWAIMALKSADLAGLEPPTREAYKNALRWLEHVTDPELLYRAGYNAPDSGKVFVRDKNESFEHHEAMTAVAVYCRIFMGRDKSDPALGGTILLTKDLPAWSKNNVDFYYWYSGSLALYQQEGPDGPNWKKWSEAARRAIIPNQRTAKNGCAQGSWPSTEDRWGFEGGQVYSTALNALTLETHYRYPRK